MKNRKCIAKAKTAPARRTLDPLYQQQLIFREDYRQCILQVSLIPKISLYHVESISMNHAFLTIIFL